MPTYLRSAIIGVFAALGILCAAFVTYFTIATPPTTSPSPVPSLGLSPVPVVSGSPTLSATLMMGEVDGIEFVAPSDMSVNGLTSAVTIPNGIGYALYEVKDVETKIPSYKDARVGLYSDVLTPTNSVDPGKRYWLDFGSAIPGDYVINVFNLKLMVKVVNKAFKWPMPFYAEMQLAQLGAANNLPDQGQYLEQRIQLAKDYAAILRAHGIEPVKHAVTTYPDTTFKNFKWNELILNGRIAPPCIFGMDKDNPPSIALLTAIEAAIKNGTLPADSFAYFWDEGEGNVDLTAMALARAKFIKQISPSLKTLTTRQASAEFNPYVDIYVPVVNWYNQPGFVPASAYAGKVLGLYPSCMSNGNCQNRTSADQVAPATKFPMMVLDGPTDDPRRFVVEAEAAGAKLLLYYNTTQKITTALQPGGQYNEGGNGDGTLLYAGKAISKRLKFIRRGLNDVAWKKEGMTR